MIIHIDIKFEVALKLIDDFLQRTGVAESEGNPTRRYLGTDAFAVQACFALAGEQEGYIYKSYALKLIDLVHNTPEKHEKDPPCFHYLTRWFNTLLLAYQVTGDITYAMRAVELIKAGERFIGEDRGLLRKYWKMNTPLTEPVVESMCAHELMDGLVSVLSAVEAVPGSRASLDSLMQDFEDICQDMNWFTTDPLEIGGLLLNTARAAELSLNKKPLPPGIRTEYLLAEGIAGLEAFFKNIYNKLEPADIRLAFRECGLSLGFRVLYGIRERHKSLEKDFNELGKFLYLIEDIEDFWCDRDNQQSQTWLDHQDINEVTLASSILSRYHPQAFCITNINDSF